MTAETNIVADYYSPRVRRRVLPNSDTLVVEEHVSGAWVEYRRTSLMSNDYAYTDSRGWAQHCVRKHADAASAEATR
jgi:hypothetical protein